MGYIDTGNRRAVYALAIVFGTASVPWTYGFLAGSVPLWPSFIGSAGYYASDRGSPGVVRTILGGSAGIGYAAITVALFDSAPLLVLSLAVGVGMLVATLHPLVDILAHGPAAFLGYAVMFSVEAAGATVLGIPGATGGAVAAILSFGVGAGLGLLTDRLAGTIVPSDTISQSL